MHIESTLQIASIVCFTAIKQRNLMQKKLAIKMNLRKISRYDHYNKINHRGCLGNDIAGRGHTSSDR